MHFLFIKRKKIKEQEKHRCKPLLDYGSTPFLLFVNYWFTTKIILEQIPIHFFSSIYTISIKDKDSVA